MRYYIKLLCFSAIACSIVCASESLAQTDVSYNSGIHSKKRVRRSANPERYPKNSAKKMEAKHRPSVNWWKERSPANVASVSEEQFKDATSESEKPKFRRALVGLTKNVKPPMQVDDVEYARDEIKSTDDELALLEEEAKNYKPEIQATEIAPISHVTHISNIDAVDAQILETTDVINNADNFSAESSEEDKVIESISAKTEIMVQAEVARIKAEAEEAAARAEAKMKMITEAAAAKIAAMKAKMQHKSEQRALSLLTEARIKAMQAEAKLKLQESELIAQTEAAEKIALLKKERIRLDAEEAERIFRAQQKTAKLLAEKETLAMKLKAEEEKRIIQNKLREFSAETQKAKQMAIEAERALSLWKQRRVD